MNNKFLIIVCVVIISLIVVSIIYPWGILWFGIAILPNPPKPEITYGEFPFQLTYELSGEIKIIDDVIICQFDGFGERTAAGQHRKWKTTIKSTGGDMITLHDLRNNDEYTDWGTQVLELCFDPGNGEYYMGDIGDRQRNGSMGKWIDYLYRSENGQTGYSAFELDEAYEKYKIKIISWKVASPIENVFK